MKKVLSYLCIAALLPCASRAGGIQAYLSYATFFSPERGPYIETYITVMGNSVTQGKNRAGKYQAAVEVSLEFAQNDKVRYYNRYLLLSPESDKQRTDGANFLDQQRIILPNGTYELAVEMVDSNNRENRLKSRIIVDIEFPPDVASVSGMELVDTYSKSSGQPSILTKSGYDLLPYASDYYPESMNKIIFYAEIYNLDVVMAPGERFLVKYFIESYENERPVGNFSRFQKQDAARVNALFGEFPIEKLYSGNFNLVIEIRNQENVLLVSKKKFFQRHNPNAVVDMSDIGAMDVTASFATRITSADTLKDHLLSLRPISTDREALFADNVIGSNDRTLMQQYFHNFWANRNASDPEAEWNAYHAKVHYVNQTFGTNLSRGYETDRGRVYLFYGPPSSVAQSYNEPAAYPYEIWHYYKLKDQSNRRFVFYNPDLVTGEFTLLHSDARGEVYNSQWHIELYRRTNPVGNLGDRSGSDHVGEKAKDLYRNPR